MWQLVGPFSEFFSKILYKIVICLSKKEYFHTCLSEIQISNKIGEENFIANRPFIFYIEDESTGTILFIGKVENPLQGNGNTSMIVNLPSRFGEENEQTNGNHFHISPAP